MFTFMQTMAITKTTYSQKFDTIESQSIDRISQWKKIHVFKIFLRFNLDWIRRVIPVWNFPWTVDSHWPSLSPSSLINSLGALNKGNWGIYIVKQSLWGRTVPCRPCKNSKASMISASPCVSNSDVLDLRNKNISIHKSRLGLWIKIFHMPWQMWDFQVNLPVQKEPIGFPTVVSMIEFKEKPHF